MMRKIAETISKTQIKHSKLVLSIFIILTFLCLPGIDLLTGNVEPSLEKVMPSFIDELRLVNHMRTQFGSDITYIVLEADGPSYDVREKEGLEYMAVLQEAFEQRELVIGTESIVSRYGQNNEYPQDIIAPDLMSAGYDLTIIKVVTDTGADSAAINKLLDGLEMDIEHFDSLNPGFGIKVTGFNVLDKLTFNVIIFLTLGCFKYLKGLICND